jgi:hypothetical protein
MAEIGQANGVDPRAPLDGDAPREPESRLHAVWRIGRGVVGVLFLVVGVLGLVLPVIPGVPILIAGVALLGQQHPLVRPVAEYIERWREARRHADRSE